MPLETYVAFSDPTKTESITVDNRQILSTLGKKEDALALKLKELFEAVIKATEDSVANEAELTIEVTGTFDVKVAGGIQYLILSLGSEANEGSVAKVCLKTSIHPFKNNERGA